MKDLRRSAKSLLYGRVGRRGASLLFFAILDLVYGYSLYSPAPAIRRSGIILFASGIAPLWVWATLWTVAGLLCLFYAFRRDDQAGFAATISVKLMWGLLTVAGGAFGHVDRAYVGAAVWLCLAGWIAIIANWPEPPYQSSSTIGNDRATVL